VTGSVLAIRPRALGDVVLVTPALRALALGGAAVEVVTERRYAPLLEGLDFVRRVWPLDRTWRATLALIAALRRRRFERVVDFFGNPRTAAIAALCGARDTAGYELRGRRRAYRVRVPRELAARGRAARARVRHACAPRARGRRRVRRARDARGGGRSSARRGRAPAGGGRRAEPGRAIGLVAAGTWPTKTWPLSHAAVLARRLIAARHAVVAILGPGEERTGRDLEALAPGVAALPPCDVGVLAAGDRTPRGGGGHRQRPAPPGRGAGRPDLRVVRSPRIPTPGIRPASATATSAPICRAAPATAPSARTGTACPASIPSGFRSRS
jgi:ADP-heptose:LPS heptosyltransferase